MLTVVDSLEIKEPRPSSYRQALNAGREEDSVCWYRRGQFGERSLQRGARNLKGVDVMLSSDVHPYDLLKAERRFSRSPRWCSCRESFEED
jgi:large subunit ribosomal protein L4